MKPYLIALDQGTTSSRAILFDAKQHIVAMAQRPLTQIYPQPGYVEHDPMEIFASQYTVLAEVVAKSGISPGEVAAIGITNQRETTIVWDKETGLPVYNAIVWQCRRTAEICEQLKADGYDGLIHQKTGLLPDAYFSGTKLKWILDHLPNGRERARRGELLFGTVDTWLIWKLTDGRAHVTDYSNASRTMLFNIHTRQWDAELCRMLDIPMEMLPEVQPSSRIYGSVNLGGSVIPIAAAVGDQQAALFGQTCFEPGDCKNTYGTGCFLLMNAGETCPTAENGLITTLAATTGTGPVQYVLEGSVFVGGALMQWLRDEMGLIRDVKESGRIASQVGDAGGVCIVPAFAGLGAPYWNMYARGTIFGITRGTKPAHLIRAAEEAIAYQTADLLRAIQSCTGESIRSLSVDGGACGDDFLMQFQADILGLPVCRPAVLETTSLGAASLAGLAVGIYRDLEELKQLYRCQQVFTPRMEGTDRDKLLARWARAVASCMSFEVRE